MELELVTDSCKEPQISLMLSAAYVSSQLNSLRGDAHTQGYRLHNTPASWNTSQYY